MWIDRVKRFGNHTLAKSERFIAEARVFRRPGGRLSMMA